MEQSAPEPTLNDVGQAITVAIQHIQAEGSFDQEFADLRGILQKAQSGELTPAKALEQIQALLDARQSYH